MTDYEKQALDFLTKCRTTMLVSFVRNGKHFADDKATRDIFRVTFIRTGKNPLVIPAFGQSINESDGKGGNPPSAYDVLACLEKYEPEDFESWCREFGYDEVPKGVTLLKAYENARRIYEAVKFEAFEVNRFFTPEEMEELREIS